MRIPMLVSHYRLHSREDASMDIGDFLQLHYTGTHPDDQDDEDDRELPFKSMSGINHLDQTWPSPLVGVTVPCFPQQTVYNLYFQQGSLSRFVDGIFHPPRFV